MILKVYSEKVYLFLLIFFSFTIPFQVNLNNLALGLLILYWLISGGLVIKLKSVLANKYFWMFSAVYLIQFLGILYSTDVQDALTKLEKKAGLLVLPLVIFSIPAFKGKQLFYIILAFSVSCFLFITYAIFRVLLAYGTVINVPHLTEFIDDVIHLHHAYSGLYLVFSINSLIYFLNRYWQDIKPTTRLGIVFLVLALYTGLIILGARMALFISLVILGLQMLLFTLQKRNFRSLVFISCTILVGLVGILILPSTHGKLNELLFLRGIYHPFTPRLIQWQCCFNILGANQAFVQGVGTGDVKPLLQTCYQDKKFWGHLYNYNLHNEYLEEMVRHGLIGLSLLLLAFIYPLITAVKVKNYLYVYFILIFMLACVSESFLNRQKGVIFYAFFNALIFRTCLVKGETEDLT